MTPPLCPRCKSRERAPRRTGGFRSWCRQCESSQKTEYCRTEAGKEVQRRWYFKAYPLAERACRWCGTAFTPPRVQGYGKQAHCSAECARSTKNHEGNLRKTARRRG